MFDPSLRVILYSFICVILILSACGETTTVGGDIFSSEDLEVLYADDTELIVETVRLDSIKTYLNTDEADNCILGTLPIRKWNVQVFPTHYLGTLDDPVFGKSKSSIYTEVGIASPPIFSGSLDSVVLVLRYDTAAFYGDVNETFDIEIYRVLENFDVLGNAAYNNTTLPISSEPIGGRDNISYSLDSLNIFIPGVDSASLQPASLRIPFNTSILGNSDLPRELFDTPEAYVSNEAFNELLKGLYITTTSDGNIMPGIRVNSSTIELFYTEDDGDKQVYQYGLFRGDLISFNHIESDRDGSEAGIAAINGSAEDKIYVSGQDGFDVRIDMSDADKFQGFALNKAQLEFTVAEPAGQQDGLFPPIENLLLSEVGDNNVLMCIDDISLGFPQVNLGSLFGGDVTEVTENGTVLRKYTMNITSHMQKYLEGGASPTLLLSVNNRTDNASRAVLYGPNHPTYPAKLKLTYTAP